VESDSTPAGQDDEPSVSSSLEQALAEVKPEAREAIIQVVVLQREFPAWAVWLPRRGRSWTAVRPASARAPGADLPMIWVHAVTAAELADRMRDVDAQVDPP
jgi:hypothetical protein